MSLVLHHFRKEARYLLPRWLPWLGLLIFQLAVQLEWLFPLEENLPPGIAQLHWIVWGFAGWLTLTHSPEDRPSDHQGFIAARPLRPREYWAARTLLFLIMIVLPLALQEAIYLLLSQRPLPEVAAGAAQRCFISIACLAWLVPFTGLFRGVQLLIVLAVLYPWVNLSIGLRAWWYQLWESHALPAGYLLLPSFVHPALAQFAVLLVVLLIVHKHFFLRFAQRLTVTAMLASLLTWATLHWSKVGRQLKPKDQQLAERAQQQTRIDFSFDALTVDRSIEPGQPALSLILRDPAFHFPGNGLSAAVRQHTSKITQNGSEFLPRHRGQTSLYPLSANFWETDLSSFGTYGITDHFPFTTIYTSGFSSSNEVQPFSFENNHLPDLQQPLEWEEGYQLDWMQWRKAIDVPLKEGATASSSHARWQILKIHYNSDANGLPAKGNVTVVCRVEWQPQERDIRPGNAEVMLHSPDSKLVWVANTTQGSRPNKRLTARGEFSNWRKQVVTNTWKNVLTYPDGSAAPLDPAQLRLVAFERDYLGTTSLALRSPPFCIADHVKLSEKSESWSMLGTSSIYLDEELQRFRARMAEIPPLDANASAREVSQYLFETLTAIRITGVLYVKGDAADRDVEQALRPLVSNHLEALLAIPSNAILEDNFSDVIARLLTDEQKSSILPRLVSAPWLIRVAELRGWDKEALPLLKAELKHPALLDAKLMKWMMKSDDPEILARLSRDVELRPWGYYSHQAMRRLARSPLFHDQLKTYSEKAWRKDFQPNQNVLLSAVLFGDREALDVSIRRAQFTDTSNSSSETWADNRLSELLQLPKRAPQESPRSTIELFRTISANDFGYHPQQQRWARKQP